MCGRGAYFGTKQYKPRTERNRIAAMFSRWSRRKTTTGTAGAPGGPVKPQLAKMPSLAELPDDELDERMAAMLDAMHFTAEKREQVMGLARPLKVAMLQGHKMIKSKDKDADHSPTKAPAGGASPAGSPAKTVAVAGGVLDSQKILSGESSPGARRRMQRAGDLARMSARMQKKGLSTDSIAEEEHEEEQVPPPMLSKKPSSFVDSNFTDKVEYEAWVERRASSKSVLLAKQGSSKAVVLARAKSSKEVILAKAWAARQSSSQELLAKQGSSAGVVEAAGTADAGAAADEAAAAPPQLERKPTFIESGFTTRVEYDEWLASQAAVSEAEVDVSDTGGGGEDVTAGAAAVDEEEEAEAEEEEEEGFSPPLGFVCGVLWFQKSCARGHRRVSDEAQNLPHSHTRSSPTDDGGERERTEDAARGAAEHPPLMRPRRHGRPRDTIGFARIHVFAVRRRVRQQEFALQASAHVPPTSQPVSGLAEQRPQGRARGAHPRLRRAHILWRAAQRSRRRTHAPVRCRRDPRCTAARMGRSGVHHVQICRAD